MEHKQEKPSTKNKAVEFGGVSIAPGEQRTVDIPLALSVAHTQQVMTAHIINGKRPGPCVFVSAAIHGDEINGIEIIRRLLLQRQVQKLRGTLVAIPVVNVHGFVTQSRYLPDGRDLNRSFPGSPSGSLAARMANTFLEQVVSKCDYGIDLHTGARMRENLPQIRADLDNPVVLELAEAFGVPAVLNSKIRDGSLREAAGDAGIPILLYEAGEALRFDEVSIRAGVRGVLNVLRHLGCIGKTKRKEHSVSKAFISNRSGWVRAPQSGIFRALVPLGAKVEAGDVLGVVADPLGQNESAVTATQRGIVIGRANLPLAHEGDALFHIAYYKKADAVADELETFQTDLEVENHPFADDPDL